MGFLSFYRIDALHLEGATRAYDHRSGRIALAYCVGCRCLGNYRTGCPLETNPVRDATSAKTA
jgi:hypothetical protein